VNLHPVVAMTLIILSIFGLLLGGLYYIRPERIVYRRIKESHWDNAKKDPEFKKWLDNEITSQINRTKRMGMIFIILEAIWLVLVLSLWQSR
jgi:hypothetical protein